MCSLLYTSRQVWFEVIGQKDALKVFFWWCYWKSEAETHTATMFLAHWSIFWMFLGEHSQKYDVVQVEKCFYRSGCWTIELHQETIAFVEIIDIMKARWSISRWPMLTWLEQLYFCILCRWSQPGYTYTNSLCLPHPLPAHWCRRHKERTSAKSQHIFLSSIYPL